MPRFLCTVGRKFVGHAHDIAFAGGGPIVRQPFSNVDEGRVQSALIRFSRHNCLELRPLLFSLSLRWNFRLRGLPKFGSILALRFFQLKLCKDDSRNKSKLWSRRFGA